MTYCTSCGAENADGTQYCVRCGAQLGTAPAPESWRASGDIGSQPSSGPGSSGGYAPTGSPSAGGYSAPGGYNEPSGYPSYTPPQQPMQYQQPGAAQPMHPAIPAIVSLMIPGAGLLFVPNKAGLGLGIIGAYVAYWIIATILSFVVIGFCLFLVLPIGHIAAAIHSWDEAAKASNGQFQPILFK